MTLERRSACKINLLLNILGKRADGFHELETVMHPVSVHDDLRFMRQGGGIQLTCSEPALPTDSTNLVHRAAAAFLKTAKINEGVRIHLDKKIPLAAGLGGGSGNAATTLLGMNDLFDRPLNDEQLVEIAAGLGSDVPFFLQSKPALATGRGERIEPLDFFAALRGVYLLLVYPGFGVSTAWVYQALPNFPEALNGRPGRARQLISRLQSGGLAAASAAFYNALEAPVLKKYPVLALCQEFLRVNGALAALISGSGSTTFALVEGRAGAEALLEQFEARFGHAGWASVVPLAAE